MAGLYKAPSASGTGVWIYTMDVSTARNPTFRTLWTAPKQLGGSGPGGGARPRSEPPAGSRTGPILELASVAPMYNPMLCVEGSVSELQRSEKTCTLE